MFNLFSNIQNNFLTYIQVTSLAFSVLLGVHAGLKFSISLLFNCNTTVPFLCEFLRVLAVFSIKCRWCPKDQAAIY